MYMCYALFPIFIFIEWGVLFTEKPNPTFSVCGSLGLMQDICTCVNSISSSTYLVVSRVWNKPCDLLSGSLNLLIPDKNHFEPFWVLKTLLHCVGSNCISKLRQFRFLKLIYHWVFLMHFCISDSLKNTCLLRVGGYFFCGGRGRVG